jgi:hypothetical protein
VIWADTLAANNNNPNIDKIDFRIIFRHSPAKHCRR